MKKILGLLIVSLCALAQGSYAQAEPSLKCGEYQHVDHWPGVCGPTACDGGACLAVCTPPPPDHCADDMHVVTERDWQALLGRIQVLEISVPLPPLSTGAPIPVSAEAEQPK